MDFRINKKTVFPKIFQKLINHFSSLPSIGPKMAERLVLYLFRQDKEKIRAFAQDLLDFSTNIRFCQSCFHVCEDGPLCPICRDDRRDRQTICVVEEPLDVIAIEKTRVHRGLYHVLGGNLSVMNAEEIGRLKIDELLSRVKKEAVKEVIVATNPTTDGDTTALYLARVLKGQGVKVTRLGRGMPTGGDIEYADDITLSSAIEGRREM